MAFQRVAVIFDDGQRPETTGVYCRRALEQLVGVQHLRPDELETTPPEPFDLTICIDDGLCYRVPAGWRPSVYWAIDTHLEFERSLARSQDFDLVFAAQRDGAVRLRREGIDSAAWLPLACDPEIHHRHEVEKNWDVAFVGNEVLGRRHRLLDEVRRRYPSSFTGRAYFEEMALIYSAARTAFNCSIENDVNMRVFEATACGSLLLTNDLAENGQAELFQDGVHLATYGEDAELWEKLAFYLKHDAERERIAAAGRTEACSRHTYRQRMETILREAEAKLSATSVRVPAAVEALAGPAEDAFPKSTHPEVSPAKDPTYFDFDRPELAVRVPRRARRVLDVGCGGGRLGERIKQQQSAEVWGIELDPQAAARAETRLDRVIQADVEQLNGEIPDGTFDCILCGDVIEHLRRPERFLHQVRGWLAPEGVLLASLPNVRNHSVVGALLAGNWTYETAGLLDQTHLQFYTRRDLEDLLAEAGFQVLAMETVPGPGYEEWEQQGRPDRVQVGRLILEGLPAEEAEEFFVYQYLVTAVPAGDNNEPPILTHTLDETPTETEDESAAPAPQTTQTLSLLYVGDFQSPGKSEQYAARALVGLGHQVQTVHDADIKDADHLLQLLDEKNYDAFLFYKGCLGAQTLEERLHPTGEAIAEVLKQSSIPGYVWYFDRVFDYDFDPSRAAWMQTVAPHCRVAFVTDGALAQTEGANWYLLRQGVFAPNVEPLFVPEDQQREVGFLGQVYGRRAEELKRIDPRYDVNVISGIFDRDLNRAIRSHKIILGPDYPSIPHYWSNRIYVVLGHGGFFLAPEVEGMAEEGFVAGRHYARLGDDPNADIACWLARPAERERIARAGQQLVLSRFTYRHRAAELARVIAETL